MPSRTTWHAARSARRRSSRSASGRLAVRGKRVLLLLEDTDKTIGYGESSSDYMCFLSAFWVGDPINGIVF